MPRGLFSRKGKEAAESSGGGFVPGIPKNYAFTEPDPNDKFKYKDTGVTDSVRSHPEEPYEWLRFPGTEGSERYHYLNRLQDLRYKPVVEPKIVSWSEFDDLKLQEPILKMLTVKYKNLNGQIKEFNMWKNVFHCDVPPVREWCLEFLSTLRVETNLKERDFNTRKVIHFRAGGIQRHCTVPEFAFLTGMVSRSDLNSIDTYDFLSNGIYDPSVTGFRDGKTTKEFWFEIGGSDKLSMAVSKAAEIKIPILKVVHRLITHCFLVRNDHNEKVSPTDVWLMRFFYEGSPYAYACAPYILAKYLVSHKDRVLVCGNFICHVFDRLGLDSARNLRGLNRFPCAPFGLNDLMSFGLIYEVNDENVFVGDLPEEQRPVYKRRRDDGTSAPQFAAGSSSASAFDLSSLQGSMFGLQGTTDMLLDNARTSNSMLQRMLGRQERYSSMWEQQYGEYFEQQHRGMDETERPALPAYVPHEIVPPSQGTFDYLFPSQGYQQETYSYRPPEFDPSTHTSGYGMYTGAPRYGGDFFNYSPPAGNEAAGRSTMGTPSMGVGDDLFSEGRTSGGGDGVPSIFTDSP